MWQKRKLGSRLSPPLTSVLTFICYENCYVRHILLFPVCLKVCGRGADATGIRGTGAWVDWSFVVLQIFGFPLLLPSSSAGGRWLCFTSQRRFLHFSHWLLPLIHCTHCCLWTPGDHTAAQFYSLMSERLKQILRAVAYGNCTQFLFTVVEGCLQINVNWGSLVLDLGSMDQTWSFTKTGVIKEHRLREKIWNSIHTVKWIGLHCLFGVLLCQKFKFKWYSNV